jgi:hypothetical protein
MKRRKIKRKTQEELEREQREEDAAFREREKWYRGFDGQRYLPQKEDEE